MGHLPLIFVMLMFNNGCSLTKYFLNDVRSSEVDR
jgi:hypothetical protein